VNYSFYKEIKERREENRKWSEVSHTPTHNVYKILVPKRFIGYQYGKTAISDSGYLVFFSGK
jgi:hypothetical protein